jgi:hypothetical protein
MDTGLSLSLNRSRAGSRIIVSRRSVGSDPANQAGNDEDYDSGSDYQRRLPASECAPNLQLRRRALAHSSHRADSGHDPRQHEGRPDRERSQKAKDEQDRGRGAEQSRPHRASRYGARGGQHSGEDD